MLAIAVALPVRLWSQTEGATAGPLREGSLPFGILLTEAYAFGSGFAARSETGARVVGALDGLSGVAVLGIAALTERKSGRPEFAVPYGVGLLALSYYNFASASSRSRESRLWTNALGFNAVVLVSVVSAEVLRPNHHHRPSRFRVELAPASVHVNIAF